MVHVNENIATIVNVEYYYKTLPFTNCVHIHDPCCHWTIFTFLFSWQLQNFKGQLEGKQRMLSEKRGTLRFSGPWREAVWLNKRQGRFESSTNLRWSPGSTKALLCDLAQQSYIFWIRVFPPVRGRWGPACHRSRKTRFHYTSGFCPLPAATRIEYMQ